MEESLEPHNLSLYRKKDEEACSVVSVGVLSRAPPPNVGPESNNPHFRL